MTSATSRQLELLRRAFGVWVEYRRGDRAIRLKALIGQTETEAVLDTGIVAKNVMRDFLIGVCDLQIDGEPFRPERGDQICRTDLAGCPVFEVLPDGEDCFRFCDPDQTQYRIHTKEIGSDP